MIFAWILVIIGALFFLKNADIIAWNWNIVWPLLLVALGIYFAWAWRRGSAWCHQAWDKISKKFFE